MTTGDNSNKDKYIYIRTRQEPCSWYALFYVAKVSSLPNRHPGNFITPDTMPNPEFNQNFCLAGLYHSPRSAIVSRTSISASRCRNGPSGNASRPGAPFSL